VSQRPCSRSWCWATNRMDREVRFSPSVTQRRCTSHITVVGAMADSGDLPRSVDRVFTWCTKEKGHIGTHGCNLDGPDLMAHLNWDSRP